MKVAIYTTNFGDYDYPHNVSSNCPYDNYDFFYITDADITLPKTSTIKIDELLFDGYGKYVRTSRYYRTHPKLYFENYDINIYLDANYTDIDFHHLNKYCIEIYDNKFDLIITKHPKRKSVKQEIEAIARGKKEKLTIMKKQYSGYINEGFSDDIQIAECGIQIRKTHSVDLSNLLEVWWNEIENKSYRDQLSFTYSLWKSNFTRYKYIDYKMKKRIFKIAKHKKKLQVVE